MTQKAAKGGAETQSAPEQQAADDLKVVLSLKGDITTVGVQKPGADPYIESLGHATLDETAARVASIVARARAAWDKSPTYPAYEKPGAQPTPARPARPEPAQPAAKKDDQPKLL